MADSSRDELTRQAEKHLRQGRTDLAIEVYGRLAQLAPTDWNIVKQLADLHERAGQREAAAGRFLQCADYYFQEGFHPKAAALYRKVLKLEPHSEHALCQLADVSLQLKLKVDARQALSQVLTLRQRRGDADGVRAIEARLAELEPDDARGRAGAAPSVASVSTGAPEPAPTPSPEEISERLRTLARDAEAAGDADGAYRAWSAVLERHPDDRPLRLRLAYAAIDQRDLEAAVALVEPLDYEADALAARFAVAYRGSRSDLLQAALARVTGWQTGGGGELVHAVRDHLRGYDASLGDLWCGMAVDAFVQQGRATSATALIESADARHPLPPECHLRWVELCVDAGLEGLDRAQQALATSYVRTGRPELARAVVEDLLLRRPEAEHARALARRVYEACGEPDPDRCVVALLSPPAPSDVDSVSEPDAGGIPHRESIAVPARDEVPAVDDVPLLPDVVTPTVAPPLLAASETASAATWMDGLVGAPSSAPAEPAPHAADASSFDWAALLGRDVPQAAERALETAEFRAEPQIASPMEPNDGQPALQPAWDADVADAEPFLPVAEAPTDLPEPVVAAGIASGTPEDAPAEPTEPFASEVGDDEPSWAWGEPLAPAADLESEGLDAVHTEEDPGVAVPTEVAPAGDDGLAVEIDLTELVEQLSQQAPPVLPDVIRPDLPPPDAPVADTPAPVDTPGASDDMLDGGDEAARGLAAQQVAAGRVFAAAGLASEAARAFERATRDVRTRFEAAEALADLHRSRGQLAEAMRWYEEAAHAPVPDAAIRRPVLYDLAETLEAVGQPERALAVLLDLLSEVEDYRDARAKADRLLRVDAGG